MDSPSSLRGCPACALVQSIPPLARGQVARCTRCGVRLADGWPTGARNARAGHAAWAALLLYPVAVSLPILRIERLGRVSENSVWSGSLGLIAEGQTALGTVVFLCSIVVPLAKLLTLMVLVRRPHAWSPPRRARAWRALELCGRFGMLDVLLVSILVAWLELGSWVTVTPGPAAVAFCACVLCSLLASAWFDPHALWQGERA
jgi:paraquat-inducible protein A